MKPKKLEITGLNSFVEKQTIDFEELTKRGLFGIFGPTGSGKSSILDAMILALYGQIPRGTKEFINTEKGEANVGFEFELGPKMSRKKYMVERSMKKDLKTGGYKTGRALLAEVKGEDKEVLCDKARDVDNKIIELIGLSCEDFTRSVVLPQGKFSEFLRLKGIDRRRMLERIFNLEKLGSKMTERIRDYKRKNETIKSGYEGQMKRYEGVSLELYNEKIEYLKIIKNEMEKLRKEQNIIEDQYEKSKQIWELQNELAAYDNRLENTKLNEAAINIKRKKLDRAKKAILVLPYIKEEEGIKERIEDCTKKINALSKNVIEISEKINIKEEKYKEAQYRKDNELLGLIEKEAKLKQAISIFEETTEIEKERYALLKQYNEKKTKGDNIIKELELLNSKKEENRNILDSYEQKIKEIIISPEFKEQIFEAYSIEKEYKDLDKKLGDFENKIIIKEASIKKASLELKIVQEEKNKMSDMLKELEEKKEELLKNNLGDKNNILSMKDELSYKQKMLEENKQNASKKEALEIELKLENSSMSSLKDEITIQSKGIEYKKSLLKELENSYEKIRQENYAAILYKSLEEGEPCPVCGSKHHVKKDFELNNLSIDQKTAEIDILKNEINNLLSEISMKNIDAASKAKLIEIKQNELNEATSKLNGTDIKKSEEELASYKYKFNSTITQIENWEKDKAIAEKTVLELKEEIHTISMKEAKLNEGLDKDTESLNSLKAEALDIKEKYNNIKEKYSILINRLSIKDARYEYDRVIKYSKMEEEYRNKAKAIKNELDTIENKKEELDKNKNLIDIEKARIEEIGKEKRALIDTNNKKILELSEGKNVEKYLKEVKDLIQEIKSDEQILKEELQNIKEKQNRLNEEKISEEKNLETLNSIYEKQHEKLIKGFDENSFEDKYDVLASILDKNEIELIEKAIKAYDEEVSFVHNNIKNIKDKLKGESIESKVWEDIINRRQEVKNAIEEKTALIAAMQGEALRMEKDLDEIKKIQEELNALEHVLDLLDDLDKLVQGNKFVEFASTNQLKYISLEASNRLKSITNERYALELNSESEFVMRDDFNGGVKRSVDTLSGGETFLTSLCLAIALSSHIQLKGKAPLEFFFLDEGFGTLDSELLETVMQSLEKLQCDKLSVGIISHVEELKNRVPMKLIVEAAKTGMHGTRVNIQAT